jgi:amino acid transporter
MGSRSSQPSMQSDYNVKEVEKKWPNQENSFPTSESTDVEIGEMDILAAGQSTQRGLRSRHAQMIALGGTIGTGLFVGTGQALSVGGPALLFLGYCIITVFVYGIVTATTEISAYMPTAGSTMASYVSRYVSTSLGFAMGWLYWYSFAIIVPYEITAAALIIDYWPNIVPTAV